MLNPIVIQILVNRIKNKGINPKTNKVMVLEDIKIKEYADEVAIEINSNQST